MDKLDLGATEDRIAAARTRLILDKPFLGALVLRLELRDSDPSWCPTTGTDARHFYYNSEYIASLKGPELQFVLAHEALHCALSHFARRQHRVKHRWDLACDYAINPILLDEGLVPPPGIQVLEEYRGMSAEEIYPLIKDNDMSETMDQHLYDKPDTPREGGQEQRTDEMDQRESGSNPKTDTQQAPKTEQPRNREREAETSRSDSVQPEQQQRDYNPEHEGPLQVPPPPLTPQEIEALEEKWQQRMAGAAQQAKQAGKLSEGLARFVETQLSPTLPWRQLLATHLSATARDDYSYARPNSRRGDPSIFPVLRSSQVNLLVAVDVSGSISDQELNEYLAEVNAIKGQLRARISLIAADDRIAPGYPQTFEAWEDIRIDTQVKGGGGTDFRPVFDWAERLDIPVDVLVYFTDAQGQFPKHAPGYPVVWLIKGKSPVPWGERIQLN